MTTTMVNYRAALEEQRTINDDMHEMATTIWHQLDWEKLLIPGPSSIAILGKLTIVGLVDQIKFAEGKKPYEHLTSLDFRTGVIKLRKEFSMAFSESFTKMDELQKQCGTLLGNTHGTLELVLEYDMEGMPLEERNRTITKLLPGRLEQMLESVSKCDKYVTECVIGFKKALATAYDLEEASTYTFGVSEEQTKLLQLRELQLKKQIEGATERKEIASKYLEDSKKARDRAEKRFDRALNDMPKGGELLLVTIGEKAAELGSQAGSMLIQRQIGLANFAVTTGADLVKAGAGAALEHYNGRKNGNPSTSADKSTPPAAEEIDFSDPVFGNADGISEILTTFKSVVTTGSGKSVNWNAVIASDGAETSLGYVISTLDELAEDNDDYGKSKEAQEAKRITVSALENANKLKGFAKDRDSPDVQTIVSSVKSLSSRAYKLSTNVTLKSKRPAISSSLTPAQSAQPPLTPEAPKTENKTIVQAATDNAQFSLVKAETQLDATRECYAKANESMLQITKEMADFNAEIAAINPQKIEWEKVRKVLGHAIGHLTQLVYSLTQLSEFFSCIRATVTEVLKPRVTGFVGRAKTQLGDLRGLTFDIYSKKTFAKDCLGIASLTFVMRKIGQTYIAIYNSQVSTGMKYLSEIPTTNQDGKDQNGTIIASGKALEEWSLVAQEDMRNILQNNLQEFNNKLQEQQAKIGKLAAMLPPPPPEMKQEAETAKIEEVANETAIIKKKTLAKFVY